MSNKKSLREFIQQSRIQGLNEAAIRQQLIGSGWAEAEVDAEIKAVMSATLVPPSPHNSSAQDITLNLGVFVTLYVAVINLGTLLFQLINKFLTDPWQGRYDYYMNGVNDRLRLAAAGIIVAWPLFLWINTVVQRQLKNNPIKTRLGIRRGLVYLTLFVTGVVIMSSLISIVYKFLGGDLELRFLLKALTVLVLGGVIFLYYLPEARSKIVTN